MNKISKFQKYLTVEIAIEFKACLYFFTFLCYYCFFRFLDGVNNALTIHMVEMILATYFMGYFQVLCLNNFDEGDKFGLRETLYTIGCSLFYTLLSKWFGWFANGKILVGFFFWCVLVYVCAFWVYKVKREIDGKILNNELEQFKARSENKE